MIDWPTVPDLGVFLAWPELGIDAFHPEDIELGQRLIPSDRVFVRTGFDGTYYRIEYGEFKLRIRPSMWLAVRDEGFRIGESVEVVGRFLQNDPCIATIQEMRYATSKGVIQYTLRHADMALTKPFLATDLVGFAKHEPLRPRDEPAPVPKDLDPSPDPLRARELSIGSEEYQTGVVEGSPPNRESDAQ